MSMERRTRQREAIWEFIRDVNRPVGPPEIHEGAQVNVDRLGIATVYRAIKSLVEEGRIVAVSLPGHPPRYEVAGLRHHHHFFCDDCERVFELTGCDLGRSPSLPFGFSADRHEVTVYGRCAECEQR